MWGILKERKRILYKNIVEGGIDRKKTLVVMMQWGKHFFSSRRNNAALHHKTILAKSYHLLDKNMPMQILEKLGEKG